MLRALLSNTVSYLDCPILRNIQNVYGALPYLERKHTVRLHDTRCSVYNLVLYGQTILPQRIQEPEAQEREHGCTHRDRHVISMALRCVSDSLWVSREDDKL